MNRVPKYLKFHRSLSLVGDGDIEVALIEGSKSFSQTPFYILKSFVSSTCVFTRYFAHIKISLFMKKNYCVAFCVLLQTQTITVAYCNGGDNNMSVVRCCNNTNFCNRDIRLKLPMEREGFHNRHGRPRPSPLVRPHPTSSTSTWSESCSGRLGGRSSVH